MTTTDETTESTGELVSPQVHESTIDQDRALQARPASLPSSTPTPMQMLQFALEKDADMEKIKQLMDLADRHEASEARRAFHRAMAAFKSEPIEIVKSNHVRYQKRDQTWTDYWHANLADIIAAASPAMSKHGLSHSWTTMQGEGGRITVECVITHELGHSQSTSLSGSPDDSGGKNNIQAVGSTVQYLQRYTFMALTGLAAQGQDDDAQLGYHQSDDVETINDDQAQTLMDLVKITGTREDSFLEHAGAESYTSIAADKYENLLIALRQRKAHQEKKAAEEAGQADDASEALDQTGPKR